MVDVGREVGGGAWALVVVGVATGALVGGAVGLEGLPVGPTCLPATEDGCKHAAIRVAVRTTTMTNALRRMDPNVLGIGFESREEPDGSPPVAWTRAIAIFLPALLQYL